MRSTAERNTDPDLPDDEKRRRFAVRPWTRLARRLRGDRGHIVPAAYYLVARQGFPDEESLAAALGIDVDELGRWKRGQITADEQRLLRDLAVVVSELLPVVEAEAIPAWLTGRAAYEQKSALDWLREGNLAEVLLQVNATAHGAFS